jgi:hypothetical protein
MSVTFATLRFAAAGVAASARGDADGRSTAKAAAMIAGIVTAESGRGRGRRSRAMYRNLWRGTSEFYNAPADKPKPSRREKRRGRKLLATFS